VPDYLAHEGLERAERAQEHLTGDAPPLLRAVPLAAAVLAVLAGLSSLYGNRLSESMLNAGNDALLEQTRAADTWNEYEAQSLKKHIAADLAIATSAAPAKRQLGELERKFGARENPLYEEAKQLEHERDASLERVDRFEKQKLRFDVATALFQISIVLASIAVLARRPALFIVGIAGGVAGIVYCILGLLR
jgi:hypothetical protein